MRYRPLAYTTRKRAHKRRRTAQRRDIRATPQHAWLADVGSIRGSQAHPAQDHSASLKSADLRSSRKASRFVLIRSGSNRLAPGLTTNVAYLIGKP